MPDESAEVLDGRDWMTASKAGRLLGVHRNTVIHRSAKGEFRTRTVGDVLFVHAEDVEAAVKATGAAALAG